MKHHIIIFFFAVFFLVPTARALEDIAINAPEKIWDVTARKFIPKKLFHSKMKQNKIILINSKMDNPYHHKLVSDIIQTLIHNGQRPTLFFANMERSKQNAFTIFRQKYRDTKIAYDATGLEILLNWSNSGQPKWEFARPVFDLAMIKKLPIRAVKLSRYEVGEIFNQGKAGLPNDLKDQLQPLLSQKLPEKITTFKKHMIAKAFCNILPEETLNKLALSDQIQQAYLALSLSRIKKNESAILITGENHIFKKSALTHYLKKLEIQDPVIILQINDTGKEVPLSEQSADFIWYTAHFPRKDPCVMIRK